jgi:predicted DNA-binding transcriptional regulator AlpA
VDHSRDWITVAEFSKLLGYASKTIVYRLRDAYPMAFPKPFRPLGPKGNPRWLRGQAETFKRFVEMQGQSLTFVAGAEQPLAQAAEQPSPAANVRP